MPLLRILLSLCFFIAFGVHGANGFGPLEGYDRPGSLQDAMNTYGLDAKLASILDKYYRNNFSSQQEWHELKSIRYGGTLFLDGGELRFNAYKKKDTFYFGLYVRVGYIYIIILLCFLWYIDDIV